MHNGEDKLFETVLLALGAVKMKQFSLRGAGCVIAGGSTRFKPGVAPDTGFLEFPDSVINPCLILPLDSTLFRKW